MDEQALRAMVREAISRHRVDPAASAGQPGPLVFVGHMSHYRYTLPKSEGPCLIEPSVQCNSCGYCESHGH
jgi:hypothetical protein